MLHFKMHLGLREICRDIGFQAVVFQHRMLLRGVICTAQETVMASRDDFKNLSMPTSSAVLQPQTGN